MYSVEQMPLVRLATTRLGFLRDLVVSRENNVYHTSDSSSSSSLTCRFGTAITIRTTTKHMQWKASIVNLRPKRRITMDVPSREKPKEIMFVTCTRLRQEKRRQEEKKTNHEQAAAMTWHKRGVHHTRASDLQINEPIGHKLSVARTIRLVTTIHSPQSSCKSDKTKQLHKPARNVRQGPRRPGEQRQNRRGGERETRRSLASAPRPRSSQRQGSKHHHRRVRKEEG